MSNTSPFNHLIYRKYKPMVKKLNEQKKKAETELEQAVIQAKIDMCHQFKDDLVWLKHSV